MNEVEFKQRAKQLGLHINLHFVVGERHAGEMCEGQDVLVRRVSPLRDQKRRWEGKMSLSAVSLLCAALRDKPGRREEAPMSGVSALSCPYKNVDSRF
jgi:hypothetical protein